MYKIDNSELNKINGGWFFPPFIWGSIVGAISYAIKHKDKSYNIEAFSAATIGGGVTGSFGALGAAGKVIGLANTVNAIEFVNYLDNQN